MQRNCQNLMSFNLQSSHTPSNQVSFKMKINSAAFLGWLITVTEGFTAPGLVFRRTTRLSAKSGEFDFLLNENGGGTGNPTHRMRRVTTPSQQKVQMVSSVTAPATGQDFDIDEEAQDEIASTAASFENADEKLSQYQVNEGTSKFGKWLNQADFQEVVWTLLVPTLIAFAGLKYALGKANVKLSGNAEEGLESFANELIFHDGNFNEMQLCKQDWDGRLNWLGPSKKKRMLNAYMEEYAKRKPVSPQAISSMSYTFTLFGLSEEKAAETMVSLCKAGGVAKISSANKLLFFGTHIFESEAALSKLGDIKNLIKGTYSSEAGADEIVATSQYAMGEAAYRTVVQKTGQTSKLPDGWQVLGLSQDAAVTIYEEEKDSGFKTASEEIYGGQNERYNEKGQRVDAKGFAIEEEDIKKNEQEKEWESESSSTGGVFECENCGYVLFVAKGRDFKFFGADFVCPECGSAKDQFKSRDDLEP